MLELPPFLLDWPLRCCGDLGASFGGLAGCFKRWRGGMASTATASRAGIGLEACKGFGDCQEWISRTVRPRPQPPAGDLALFGPTLQLKISFYMSLQGFSILQCGVRDFWLSSKSSDGQHEQAPAQTRKLLRRSRKAIKDITQKPKMIHAKATMICI